MTNRDILKKLTPVNFKIGKQKERGFGFIEFDFPIPEFITDALKEYPHEEGQIILVSDTLIKTKTSINKPVRDFIKETINANRPNLQNLIKSLATREGENSQDSQEWKEERKRFFSSTSTHLVEANLYKKATWEIVHQLEESSPLAKSILERESLNSIGGIEWGNKYEPIARMNTEEILGQDIEEMNLITVDGINFATSVDGMATIDEDIVIDGIELKKGERIVFEYKCPSYSEFLNPEYKNHLQYRRQQTNHFIVTGCDRLLFIKFFPYSELKIEEIPLDEEMAFEMLSTLNSTQDKLDSMVASVMEEQARMIHL